MTKPTIFYDPVLQRSSTTARFRGIITSLEAKVAELEAMGPEIITVEVPVEKIVTETVTVEVPVEVEKIVEVPVEVEKIVEVPVEVEKIVEKIVEVEVQVPTNDIAFNRKYIDILRDHIKDLNEFAIESLSEDATSA